MIQVTEQLNTLGATYIVTDEDGRERAVGTTCAVKTMNEVRTYVFRDAVGKILFDPSCFLTDGLKWGSNNTANQAVSALKALENYSQIIKAPVEAFTMDDARGFLQFLRGTLSVGITYDFKLFTQRSEATVGAYLKHIRKYTRWLGVGNSPFLQLRQVAMGWHRESEKSFATPHRLKADVVEPKEAPRYISIDEYKRIRQAIDERWGATERCVVRLMFEHGLRIGEVLGLTQEDLEWTVADDGTQRYAVVIRNRASDRDDQHAKMLMRVSDPRQYKSADYKKRNVGTQRVYVSESMFFELTEYAEETCDDGGLDGLRRADSVVAEGGNAYLFVNSTGRPLSQNLWNKRLRRILAEANVHVDRGVRRTNLNHRFRHGYAMLLMRAAKKNGRPLDEFEVMTLMRHRSIKSTEVYHRPTREDIHEMQAEIVGELEEALYAGRQSD